MGKKQEKKKRIFRNLNKKLIASALLLIVAFFFSQIYITSLVGTKSGEIEATRIEKDKLRLENEILQSEIDEYRSTTNIKKVAERYGLVEKSIQELAQAVDENLAFNSSENNE